MKDTDMLPTHAPLAATFRGAHPENIYHGSVAVVDSAGQLVASVGDVSTPVFTRSALKPFQAIPLIARWADRFQLDEADMALVCASHSGEPMHAERAAKLLARIGASESDLACGTHVPYFYPATGETPAPGERFRPLQHNCSGKHAGMLLLAHALGESLTSYLQPEHPAQQAIAASVAHFAGIPVDQLILGIDGCSAPNYALPLHNLGLAVARLTSPEPDPVYGRTPHQVARAMSLHPELVSGQRRSDLILMTAGQGDWFSKVGADGVQVLGSFSRQQAIAAKCSSGNLDVVLLAMVSALDQLGWCDNGQREALAALTPPRMRNAAGAIVGQMRAVFQLIS